MPLTAPVTLAGNIRGAYDQKFKVQGVDGDVSLLEILQFLTENAGGSGGDSIYVESDWVIKGSTGISIASEAGVYEVSIPEGKSVSSLQTRIVNPETEFDEDGNMVVNIAWNTTEFNLGYITAHTPFVVFLDETGNQLTPAELGINVTSIVASGLTSTTIGILGSLLEAPFSVKLIF